MTAINAFYDRDDRFAYLASDGAAFSYADGSVETFGGKISVFPEFHTAMAFAGPNISAYIIAEVQTKLIANQDDLLQALAETFTMCREYLAIGAPERESGGANDMTMIIATYRQDNKRPAIYRIASNPAAVVGHPANTLHELDGVFIPSVVPDYIAERGMYVLDAVTDSRALFRAQRHHSFEGMHGAPAVGGTCSLYRVGPDGIKAWDVLEFNDQLLQVADIADTGVDVLRPAYP